MKIVIRRPICNNNPSSAPHINGRCFWLCWRCTGVVAGAFITTIFTFITDCSWKIIPIVFLLSLPACADYCCIRKKVILPSNRRRFITGVLLGIPVSMVFFSILE